MKVPTILPAMALMALLTLSCSTDAIEEDRIDAIVASYVPETKTIEIEIMELINAHRIDQGLNVLTEMEIIKAEAFGHTDYMIDNGAVSHDNFYQRRNNLVNNAGALQVGENVAYGFSFAESVVHAWLGSEGHRDVIEGDFTHFDISAEQGENGRWYYTNIFIKK
ncbi:MAG: CAP domain-containing protein [Bacteroidia bacterium]|nr:CAP domain-containing protein [Bacteroidia bacterium]NND25893.1 CAP domain-containing protein [Flavobacteriaceae bacterium]NNK59410.1 CAP domain-containing protein [Flavobacteriaceae bacterium]NNL31979.1 CAP domain-containing protein [Flavobacteriaceae bacterium]RZW46791.1 MAG: CAP domain-containing protein [Flavobacteriaceae bacterium]